jgi:predicted secreted protein
MKKWEFRIVIVTVIATAVIYGIVYFIHSLSHERTDDSYVAGI